MITYSKSFWGRIALLLRWYGSAFPRSIPISLLSTVLTIIVSLYAYENIHSQWNSDVSYQAFAYILGVVIVFRTNASHQRYFQGRQTVQAMSSAWVDACAQALAFDAPQADRPALSPTSPHPPHSSFSCSMLHYISLIHGLALQHLRRDWDLDNLTQHDRAQTPPPPAVYLGWWSAVAAGHTLRTGVQQRNTYHQITPLPVIGGITQQELDRLSLSSGTATHSPSHHGSEVGVDMHTHLLSVAEEGVTTAGRTTTSATGPVLPMTAGWGYIPGAAERVNVVLAWLYACVVRRKYGGGGGLNVEGPVVAGVFGRLSAGYTALESCRMLAETPFPFPWAQVVLVALLLYSFSLPFVVVSHVKSTVAAALITFITISTYWTLDEVGRDLEDPFVYDPNDVPMPLLQYQFNERLLQLHAALDDPPATPPHNTLDLPLTTSTQADRVLAASSSFKVAWRGAENGMMGL